MYELLALLVFMFCRGEATEEANPAPTTLAIGQALIKFWIDLSWDQADIGGFMDN